MGSYVVPARSLYSTRWIVIVGVALFTLLLFGPTLKTILGLALQDDRYLQIAAGPCICALLLFWERAEIFTAKQDPPKLGAPLLLTAAFTGIIATIAHGSSSNLLMAQVGSMVSLWIAAFYLTCGFHTLRNAIYPLSCLLLMFPVPTAWLDGAATALQHGSASAAYLLFHLLGIPALRNGMQFSLPGLDFEVAPECSGIHSSIALLLIAVTCGYVYLGSGWMRSALILATVPIAIVKNALRIVVLSSLGAYVDTTFFTGPLHHRYGGLVFSVVAIAIFIPVLALLQKLEMRTRTEAEAGPI